MFNKKKPSKPVTVAGAIAPLKAIVADLNEVLNYQEVEAEYQQGQENLARSNKEDAEKEAGMAKSQIDLLSKTFGI
jgi:hypothetical protein